MIKRIIQISIWKINTYCRVRIIFIDDNDTYVFCSNDFDSSYINKVVDVTKKPPMFLLLI